MSQLTLKPYLIYIPVFEYRLILTKPRIRINQDYKKKKKNPRGTEKKGNHFLTNKREKILYIYTREIKILYGLFHVYFS